MAMATQELPQSVPQYPEMIFKAISALNEETGSNKSTIFYYIESIYGDLPPGHIELLTQHLDKLKESGELVFVKNNYMRPPNPDAPPKRGRGRPAKPKSAAAIALAAAKAASVGPPRGRGRPPKNRDESGGGAVAEKRKVSESSGRPRGRPKKVKADEAGEGEEADLDEVVPAADGTVPGAGSTNQTNYSETKDQRKLKAIKKAKILGATSSDSIESQFSESCDKMLAYLKDQEQPVKEENERRKEKKLREREEKIMMADMSKLSSIGREWVERQQKEILEKWKRQQKE